MAEKIFQLRQFYGINENPDGDTKLKFGEAAAMRNFRVTRDGSLRKRPGTKTLWQFGGGRVAVLWQGNINGEESFLAAACGKLYKLGFAGNTPVSEELGEVDCSGTVHIFGFGGAVYIMDGRKYRSYDGETLREVAGYRPLVAVTVPPEGGGELLEQINRLCGQRRAWLSPDGTAKTFKLPEKGLKSADYAIKTADGTAISGLSFDLENGTVTFSSAPAAGVNTIEVGWTMAETQRASVEQMKFSELYNGSTDSRVFIYGDGSGRLLYSGLDYNGTPRADYFPDLNEIAVGDMNTPVTGLIRHFSRLICFKTDGTWGISYGQITLYDGSLSAAFYTVPINRTIGNEAPGQVQLVVNSPRTLFGTEVYEWKNSSSYSSNLTIDERQAQRISDRIYATLGEFEPKNCLCFDSSFTQEYFICCGERMLVHNYAADAWYLYSGIRALSMVCVGGETYIGTASGSILHLSDAYLSDDGRKIDCLWESGSMSFGDDSMRKFSARLWIGIKPEPQGEVWVSVQTDRRSLYPEKLASSLLMGFTHVNFGCWSFAVNRRPKMTRLRIKAKKFVFMKLILKSNTAESSATVLSADIGVRYTGYAK